MKSSRNAQGADIIAEMSPALAHALDCEVCLGVVANLHLPVSACESLCEEYRSILEREAILSPRAR